MKFLLVPILAVAWVCGLGAQGWDGDQNPLPVPPTGTARQSEISQGLIARTPVEHLKALSVKDSSGTTILSRMVKKGSGENLLWELRWEPGAPWGAGTWVAFRDGLGRLREIRVILLEGCDGGDHKVVQPGTWLRLVPQGRGCRMDLFLAGRLVSGGWTVEDSPQDILTSDDPWLWETTSSYLDWGALVPRHRWEDEKVEDLRIRVHKLLSTIPAQADVLWWPNPQSGQNGTSETGAPWGAWTLLPGREGEVSRGLGSWGVSLWISTGVIRGWNGGYPTWQALLQPRVVLPGYSQAVAPDNPTGEPGFALGWIRNLGLEVFQTLYPSRPRSGISADVRDLRFLDPVPDAGFPVEDFPALVHQLAVSKPGQVFLMTRNIQQAGEKGKSLSVVYGAPAVLMPWVGEDDRVRAAVYSGPNELSLEEWLGSALPGRKGVRPDHVALTALPLPSQVVLPLLPAR